ncbi:MAG: monovalent cation/H+ antiporter subunit D family protein [Hyphomicrobiaceae bacterium]
MIAAAPETLLVAAIVIPLLAAVGIAALGRYPDVREGVTLGAAAALFVVVASLVPHVLAGARPEIDGWRLADGVGFGFKVEPLGMLFAMVAGTLWFVNSVYSIGYMRGGEEPRQTQFYVCFAIAISATMALAFSKNLLTLFVFYEVLTLSTYPLVTHKADGKAKAGGRTYMLLLLGTSMGLLLPAIIITYGVAGTLDFTPGGLFADDTPVETIGLLLALFIFGIGKAAVMPFHFWLPAAMVAPTPVSALLHAVAVVKAGVFTVLKVIVYVFGIERLTATGLNEPLIYFVSFCLLAASVVALTKDNLKARLAYSTVSQLAYIVLAALLATSTSVVGGGLHIVMHAAGKITLFFCAGAIYVAAHKTEVSQLDGLGRVMPITMTAFLIGALSIIGLPPFGGTWSKWFIGMGALDAGYSFAVAVLMISSLLNVAYLLPIVGRAFFRPLAGHDPAQPVKIAEAPIACLIPLSLTAIACFVLFFTAEPIADLIELAVTTPGDALTAPAPSLQDPTPSPSATEAAPAGAPAPEPPNAQ